MEAIGFSEPSGETRRNTRRHIPEDDTVHNHRCGNLKSYIVFLYWEATQRHIRRHTACNLFACWFLLNLFRRPWRWRRYVPPKRQLKLDGLHGVISQKTLFIMPQDSATVCFFFNIPFIPLVIAANAAVSRIWVTAVGTIVSMVLKFCVLEGRKM
jgi:hypothetical protein